MNIIYKSFFKKKTTKIYLWIFISLGIVFSFLIIARKYLIIKSNEAYPESFLVMYSKDNINLEKEKNIKSYNKAINVDCNNHLTNVFITEHKPIFTNESEEYLNCNINNYIIEYTHVKNINIIKNPDLYNSLKDSQEEFYYFISLKSWFDKNKTAQYLSDKYHTEVGIEEYKIDSMDYKNIIVITDLFIKISILLFVILSIITIANIIIDEKKNNFLYYALGYSKIKIISININKIFLIIVIPLCILTLSSVLIYFM